MKISTALKLKNTLTGEIRELEVKLAVHNRRRASKVLKFDFDAQLAQLDAKRNKLALVKAGIALANAGNTTAAVETSIPYMIYALAEAKAEIAWLRKLDINDEPEKEIEEVYDAERERWREIKKEMPMTVSIGEVQRDARITALKARIESLQESLNAFAFTTSCPDIK